MQRAVERLCGGEVATERLFYDHARTAVATDFGQPLHHGAEHAGGNCEVMQRAHGTAQGPFQALEGRRIAVVPADVLQLRRHFGKHVAIHAAVLLQAVARTVAQFLQRPAGPGHPDNWNVEIAVPDHRLQGGKYLLVSQVAGGAEEHQRV